jgi:hypothetical protein
VRVASSGAARFNPLAFAVPGRASSDAWSEDDEEKIA